MKSFYIVLILSIFITPNYGQATVRHTVSGYIREAVSGEYLIGVNVYLSDHKTGTTTNAFGFYSLTLPANDSIELAISYIGFTSEFIKLVLQKDIELNIDLKPSIILDEVTITANRQEKQSESVKMSTVKVQVDQIKKVPTLLGEKDVLKVLQLMPGVQKGTEGSSGFYVRGGGPDQNLIILDDAIVYNASHLFGFFSLFNGDALKSVELIKGGFPARYGGRLSSVLEMHMKEGNKEEWHGEGGVGLISARASLEGPIKKGKSSILVSGRRSFADLFVAPFSIKGLPDYYFYDFNAKVNFDFGRNNKLYISGYFGKDKYSLKTESDKHNETAGFNWGNSTGTVRWNHLFSNKLFSNTSFIFSNYNFRINNKFYDIIEGKNYKAEYNSGIQDFSLKYDLDYIPNPKHWIKAGLITTNHKFNPYAFVEDDELYNKHTKDKIYVNGIESAIYVEDTWKPNQSLKLNFGLRLSHFIAEKKRYLFPEPRLSVAWRFENDFALKGSYAEMYQYIHLLSNTGIGLPTDLWVPVTDNIKPQRSEQVALGIVKDVEKKKLSFSFEVYYKRMNNVIAYKEGASFIVFNDAASAAQENWEEKVTVGKSWSYGGEFLVQKNAGRLTGWIGYTLSWTPMQFDSLNFGKKFYSRYDRRHDFSIVAFYKISERLSLSGSWVYGTGNAITLAGGEYDAYANNPSLGPNPTGFNYNNRGTFYPGFDYGQKNNFRMSSYHRLDLGIQFHKEKRWGERTWEISIYNVYNRMNPFYYYFGTKSSNGKDYGVLKQVTLFPVLPSFSYNIKF
jgi:hypothetical protein